MAVVPFADEGGGHGVECAGADCSGALVEVTRILMEDRRKDRVADDTADEAVGVGGAVTFEVAGCACAVAAEGVLRLLDACDDRGNGEGDGIVGGSQCQPEFLPRAER